MLFRRIFSSTQRPEDGFPLDSDGQAPEIYAERQAPNGFEKEIWKRFWELANDEKLAKEHGVHAIHGDAPYMRLEPDRVYKVLLRSTGKVIITPERGWRPRKRLSSARPVKLRQWSANQSLWGNLLSGVSEALARLLAFPALDPVCVPVKTRSTSIRQLWHVIENLSVVSRDVRFD